MDKPAKELSEKNEEKDLSETNEKEKASFECFICAEKRFAAFRPPCGHEICGVCVKKTFESDSVRNKCGMCRANLPEIWKEYGSEFHNISDLKTEEIEYAERAAARNGNLFILKDLLAQKKFAVGERVRIVGLQNRTDLNGSEGVITKQFVTSERHTVLLADGKRIKIKPKNLRHSEMEEKCVWAAAECGHIEIVKFFAELKIDLNRPDRNGATPVYIAAQNGHTEIIKLLAEYNADFNRSNDDGATPIFIAAQIGHIDIVKFLARQKTDLDGADENGVTPVYIAAQNGHIEIVKLLAEHEADLNRTNNNGATPVCISSQNGHIEIVKFLVEQKVDLNRPTNVGVTPIFVAACKGHTEIVKYLAEQKADLNRQVNDGNTPIMIAVAQGRAEIVKILINANVKVGESLMSLAETDEIKEIISKALGKK